MKTKIFSFIILTALLITSCTPNNPQPNPTPSTPQTYSVKYRFVCPSQCIVRYRNGTNGINELQDFSGTGEWEFTMQSSQQAYISALNGNGNANDQVLIEIYVDGVLKSDAIGVGTGAYPVCYFNLP
jgi:hypothetical protein